MAPSSPSPNRNSNGSDDFNSLDGPSHDRHRDTSRSPSHTPLVDPEDVLKWQASSCDSLRDLKVLKTSSGRPKAADYNDTMKALILVAISNYRSNISMVSAFPDNAKESEVLAQVWKDVCVQLDIEAHITPRIAKLIKCFFQLYKLTYINSSLLRGELKLKMRPLVEAFFGFESGLNRKIIARNCQTAEDLKDGKGFVYKVTNADTMNCKGMYQARILQKVVNVMWFHNKQDEGVVHAAQFSPLTISALALVLAAIECCIDEWITGVRTDIPFSTALYKDIYEDHVRCLECFDKITKQQILTNILVKLCNRGRFHAGAQPISTAGAPTISDNAFIAALKEYEDEFQTESDGENGDSD
ncbi:hypothetical protein L208DRAFT_1249518 [Tricholoma matsutake]|nr:hypothetical protein L208DRAFT_1249518 [Tricholoma matsutake 945]